MGTLGNEDSLEPMIPTIRAQTDLRERIANRIQLHRKGGKWWGCCPFHAEKTASFMVDTADQHFHCFSCGQHGDIIDWLMLTENTTKADAIKQLTSELGLRREPQPILSTESESIAPRDLPAMRATLQVEFSGLATRLDTCLRDIPRLAKRTDSMGQELLRDRQTEKVGIESQLTTFFNRVGFLNWRDWWAKYSDALFSEYTDEVTPSEWRGHQYRHRKEPKRTQQYGAWEWQACCQPGYHRPLNEEEECDLEIARARGIHPMRVYQEEEPSTWPSIRFVERIAAMENGLNT